jgi:predicted SnoaL-like aldol condensation-catalyzing enzyme
MSVESNKAIVRRLIEEIYNRRNPAAIDELIAPEFVNHSAPFPVRGPEGVKRGAAAQYDAFPDSHTTIEDVIAEGDKVVVRATDRFTDQRDGKQMVLTWIEILRLENGQVVEAWIEADMGPIAERLRQALARKGPDYRRK